MGVFATQQQQQQQQQQREVSDTVFSTDLVDSVHDGVLGRKRDCHAKRADEEEEGEEEAVVTMTTTEAAVTVTASPTSTTTTDTGSSRSLPTAPGSPLPFPTTTNSTSSDGSSSVVASSVVAPLPFDTTLSFNLSSSCVNFFAKFMQDDRIVNGFNDDGGCLGFGLMMRTSSGWNSM
jgi:hypothetical protein